MEAKTIDTAKGLLQKQRKVLAIALISNGMMFFLDMIFGIISGSVSLISDSLDMFSDSLAYAISLWAIGTNLRTKSIVSLFKAFLMAILGLFALSQVIYKIISPTPPVYEIMGIISFISLAVNCLSFALLWKYRGGDINLKSIWLCTRNDAFANFATILAAVAVGFFSSAWPDIIVGAIIAGIFMHTAVGIFRQSLVALKNSSIKEAP